MTATILPTEASSLRQQHYNAEVVGIRRVHDDLMVLRVRPNQPLQPFSAGQYTTLGLGDWERAAEDDFSHEFAASKPKLIRRTYSLSCPILNSEGDVVPPSEWPFWEFYIAIVPPRPRGRPQLTPKLANLRVGSTLKAGPKVAGKYTLQEVQPDQNLVFLATGTGEAPHNAMIAELLANGHRGQIASFVCTRYQRDLGYAHVHQQLMERFPNYHHLGFSTRDTTQKRYLQTRFLDGELEAKSGFHWDPTDTHIYLCGNPAMIGGQTTENSTSLTSPGMVELLAQRGFQLSTIQQSGTLHTEKYW